MKIKHLFLALYFTFYAIYLFFFKIQADKDVLICVKPFIVPAIVIYYYLSKTNKENSNHKIHYLIFALMFFADNLSLIYEEAFVKISMFLYLLILALFSIIIIKDSQLFNKNNNALKNITYFFMIIFVLGTITKIIGTYVINFKFDNYLIIMAYIIMFLSIFIFSMFNFLKIKSKSSKYFFLFLTFLFISDFFAVINRYYFKTDVLFYISIIAELPTYFILSYYFISRDKENYFLNKTIQ